MLPSADDFVSHLWAVTNLPGLGLREAKQTCTWKPDEKVNFQFDDAEDWVKADRPNAEIEARRAEWHAFVRGGMIPYSAVADRFTNRRGLVILAGNQDTVSRVGVILRALQKLGSKVAIEIHYFVMRCLSMTGRACRRSGPGCSSTTCLGRTTS
ncbi:hypothetical protein MCOR02_011329 [Pyricularia oryzae]|nr:hypothetical protein MCOR02_011329 [Pyricularia oryzae]